MSAKRVADEGDIAHVHWSTKVWCDVILVRILSCKRVLLSSHGIVKRMSEKVGVEESVHDQGRSVEHDSKERD